MSAKIMSSLTDENRDMRKQIGCRSIFHLFNRHHFLTSWRLSSHNQKRLLPGPQHQLEPHKHNATRAIIEKDRQLQKQKPRVPTRSSQASVSSTFSSRDYNSTNTSESQFHSSTNNLQSPDIRDVVKDSMHREARGLPIKSRANDARKVTVMKHIDSPRPLQQSKTTVYEGSPRGFCKVQECTKRSNDERITLHRFSYDGRELRDTCKTTMKIKELPRLSLDSKTSSMKCSSLVSSLNVRNENSSQVLRLNQEPGSHSRSNSIVAKLMGLHDFPDTLSTDEDSITKIKSSPSPSPRAAFSSAVPQKNPTSSSPRMQNASSVRKPTTCSRLPMEPAPWKQRDPQGSPKMTAQSKKAPKNIPPPSSVYGEIEKRITELEFKSSGKNLRALKQILQAMKKTRERIENQIEESAEVTPQKSCSNQNPDPLMWQNRKTYEHVRTVMGSSIGVANSAKVMEKVKTSSSNQVLIMETPHLQRIQTQGHKYHRENQAQREKEKNITPRNNIKESRRHIPSVEKKTTWRNLEVEQTLSVPQRVENCTTSGRGFRPVSPRLQQNVLGMERESHATNLPSDSSRITKHSRKNVREKCPQNRKHKVKSMDLQLSDDQLSELSSEMRHSSYQGDTASVKSESNNSLASHTETEIISAANSVKTNSRQQEDSVSTSKEQLPKVELRVIMSEQPSPVSVLDPTFYSEDSPSPIKKKSTAFRDESPSSDEAEWHLENPSHLTDCTESDPGYKHNQMSEKMLQIVREPRSLKTEIDETATNQNESANWSLDPDHRYINKILQASGLFKDTSIIATADQLLSLCHLMNPNMFHALEEMEDPMDEANAEPIQKNDRMKLKQRSQRKIVFDTVNELLVRKITSNGLFTPGRKRLSPEGVVKEVYSEMDYLCGMPCSNLDDEDDGSIGLLTGDMKYQSEDWTEYSTEFPALVLDIERLIFKDLITEVVTGEVVSVHGWPKRNCRQLFI